MNNSYSGSELRSLSLTAFVISVKRYVQLPIKLRFFLSLVDHGTVVIFSCCSSWSKNRYSSPFLVGAFIIKRARLLQSLVFFIYLRQTRSDER